MLRLVAIMLVAAGAWLAGHDAAQASDDQAWDDFGIVLVPQPKSSVAAKWRVIQLQMADDAARLSACRIDAEACSIEDRRLEDIVDGALARQGLARIGEINRTINLSIRPMSDQRRFGIRDHWSAPLETLQAGVGDCEDYAILKYLALRESGFAADDLQFLIVRDPLARSDHAVVAVRLEARWLVLDNRTFAMADLQAALQFKRYRVLAQFGSDTDVPGYASVAALSLDVM